MGELESTMRSLSEEISEAVLIGITGKDGLSVATFSKEQLGSAEYSAEISSIFLLLRGRLRACLLEMQRSFLF